MYMIDVNMNYMYEILNIIKTKRQNEKCKKLIDKLKLIDKT